VTHLIDIDTVGLLWNLGLVAAVFAFVDEFFLLGNFFWIEEVVGVRTETQTKGTALLGRLQATHLTLLQIGKLMDDDVSILLS